MERSVLEDEICGRVMVRGTGFQRGKRGKEGEKEGTLNTKIDVKMSPLIQVRLNY